MWNRVSDIKRKVISLLDQVFPEYEQLFSDTFSKSSTEVLMNYTLPEDLLEIDPQELANLLQEASNGRYGESRALKSQSTKRKCIKYLWHNYWYRCVQATDSTSP